MALTQRPPPSLARQAWRRLRGAVGTLSRLGRRRKEPHRHTDIYARLRQIGSWNLRDSRPTIKPVPANLRYFSRTPYASRAIAHYTAAISSLDWQVRPRADVKENAEIKRQIKIANDCLEHPNKDDSWTSLVQQIVEDYCVSGAGVIEQQIGGDPARPLWLWPVDALSIQIYANWDGDEAQPRYCQSYGYGNVGVAKGKDLLNRELIYIRDRPTTDSPFSFGMLEIAFESISRLLGVAEYAGNVAANAHPLNLIFLAGAGQDELEAFRAYWRNEIEGQGLQPIMGLPNMGTEKSDFKVLQLRGNDDDSLFLNYQTFVIREIATAFRESPQNLGVEADVNRNTSEVAEDRDWDLGIKPMARTIARYINREAIWGRLGFSQIELVPGGLDREDELATAEIYKIEYTNNAIVPDEYRAKHNLEPMGNVWGQRTYAEVQIAIQAARSAAQVDPELTGKE